jgi:hypothetical protein
MEKSAAIDAHPATAQLPIGPQQKVVRENLVLKFIQCPAAHEYEVCNVFLIFASPTETLLTPGDVLERDLAHVLLFRGTVAETGKTRPEYGPQHAIAGDHFPLPAEAQS